MDAVPLRMVIELDPGEPIAGRIECSGNPARPFRGWLELSSQVERLRAVAEPTSSPSPTDSRDPDPPIHS